MTLAIVPRTDWQKPSQPVIGPVSNPAAVDTLVIHYTAAAKVGNDTAAYLRAIHNDYTVNRGYSIGYNFAVSQDGRCWELRGTGIKCAANKGHNDHAFAILMLVDGANPANPAMIATTRLLVAHIRTIATRATRIVGHGQLMPTGCPGTGLQAQVNAGVFEPITTPTPPPSTGDDPVKYRRVYVPNDPTRAEAFVALEMIGFDNSPQRDAVRAVFAQRGLVDKPLTAAQYDALLAVYGD